MSIIDGDDSSEDYSGFLIMTFEVGKNKVECIFSCLWVIFYLFIIPLYSKILLTLSLLLTGDYYFELAYFLAFILRFILDYSITDVRVDVLVVLARGILISGELLLCIKN